MFKKIDILIQVSPLITEEIYVNNQEINNVLPPNSDGIILFYSGNKQFAYLGTLLQFKTDLGL